MKKVLIANRGEIALRVIRACHEMDISTVAVYSEADAEALHVHVAKEAVCIGRAPSIESYLKVSSILSACQVTGADGLHPGYGFLSENANFASICESCDVQFIGPSAKSIALLGNKAAAKNLAKSVGCPVIPGSNGIVEDMEQALEEGKRLGFPLLIKAVGGGGGKGIRVAQNEEELAQNFLAAKAEAEVSFKEPDVYLEKMIQNPRHVEIQILADKYGNCVHLGERDCSIQRRRQKLIEEAPSPRLSEEMRYQMGQSAIAIAKAANYFSAGTVEFLLDQEENFYFMEVNTRIQVEHTVSEELTGIDLVKEQIRIEQGEKLGYQQSDISFNGHVIECRINAENPMNHFSPSPGDLRCYLPPGGPHLRVDSACYTGYRIPPYYDSMIAKLIVRGKDRREAICVLRRALREFHIDGVDTTIPFHLFMADHAPFFSGEYTIDLVDRLIADGENFVMEEG
ncbi:MAG: acetyl-CoA carboxylase biotin carboxylase subunit [Chlamydiota bacterium]